MHQFGPPRNPVLVIGGIHGDEPTSVDVANALIDELKQAPPSSRGVVVLPVANPDGYAIGSRLNARRVDLNRNFPSTNYKASRSPALRSGDFALSEPESKAIHDAIRELQPSVLISIHSIRGPRQCNNYDGPGQEIAQRMARHNGYPVKASIGYPTPGSLGSYAGKDLMIPMVTLELPRTASGPEAWQENRAALLDVVLTP
jgi:predicted deacylase